MSSLSTFVYKEDIMYYLLLLRSIQIAGDNPSAANPGAAPYLSPSADALFLRSQMNWFLIGNVTEVEHRPSDRSIEHGRKKDSALLIVAQCVSDRQAV
ncbi:hypothetical protein OUZ56_004331 [Daphnia magna]|uniref:Uncharacterized protein n=1 Tax=Daphnia magna TaxID=35525 RepID=A0ABQ9YPF0_9CRUS|nr:hypothetical protein OUZ56_004331 [Daphnia magna]